MSDERRGHILEHARQACIVSNAGCDNDLARLNNLAI